MQIAYILGFGFLSENAEFAKICEESNIKFIGPSYKIIDLMGNKSHAKDFDNSEGMRAFADLEKARNEICQYLPEDFDPDRELEEARKERYDRID